MVKSTWAIPRVKLRTAVAKQIHEYIKQNGLKSGDKLPSERELADILEVGRSSIREGLRILEGMGSIEIVPGKGVYVRDCPDYSIVTHLHISQEKEALMQILEIRRALEKLAVELVIARADEEDLDSIQAALLELEEKAGGGQPASPEDRRFHQALYRASGNDVLCRTIDSLSEVFDKIWDRPLGVDDLFKVTFPFHRELYEALRSRNIRQARKVVKKLFDSLETEVMAFNWEDTESNRKADETHG